MGPGTHRAMAELRRGDGEGWSELIESGGLKSTRMKMVNEMLQKMSCSMDNTFNSMLQRGLCHGFSHLRGSEQREMKYICLSLHWYSLHRPRASIRGNGTWVCLPGHLKVDSKRIPH